MKIRHQMKLRHGSFEAIANGSKTIELRLFDEKRKRVKVGDEIEFTEEQGEGRKVLTEVASLHVFPDFKTLYSVLPLEKCGYGANDSGRAAPEDMLEYYSIEEQKEFGVVGIGIKLISRGNEAE